MSTDDLVVARYGVDLGVARPALTTISAADLLQMEFPDPRWANPANPEHEAANP